MTYYNDECICNPADNKYYYLKNWTCELCPNTTIGGDGKSCICNSSDPQGKPPSVVFDINTGKCKCISGNYIKNATLCLPCPAGSVVATDQKTCICDRGRVFNGNVQRCLCPTTTYLNKTTDKCLECRGGAKPGGGSVGADHTFCDCGQGNTYDYATELCSNYVDPSSNADALSLGAVIGIVVAVIAVIVGVGVGVAFALKKKVDREAALKDMFEMRHPSLDIGIM